MKAYDLLFSIGTTKNDKCCIMCIIKWRVDCVLMTWDYYFSAPADVSHRGKNHPLLGSFDRSTIKNKLPMIEVQWQTWERGKGCLQATRLSRSSLPRRAPQPKHTTYYDGTKILSWSQSTENFQWREGDCARMFAFPKELHTAYWWRIGFDYDWENPWVFWLPPSNQKTCRLPGAPLPRRC